MWSTATHHCVTDLFGDRLCREDVEKPPCGHYDQGMNPHLRDLLEKATAGKLSDAESKQAIADARRELTADHHVLLQDLNDVAAAEAALPRRGEPLEVYRGVEIYAITCGVTRMMCVVKTVTLISCTREGIRGMIDEALDGSPYSDRRRRRTPSLN